MEPATKLQTLMAKRNRAFRRFMSRTMTLARIAHPATGGLETLCHNWGNDRSREIWRDGWKRWRAYAASSEAASRRLMLAHVKREG